MSDPSTVDAASLRAHLTALRKKDHFSALEVSPDASAAEIHSAFLRMAKRWHPSRFAREQPEIRALVSDIFIALKNAHDALGDPGKREVHRARHARDAAARA